MRINNNLMAMNTHRQMGITNTAQSKSMEKLSSGYRINRAGDDAAGLAISEKMRGQIRGLTQASRNSQDAISLVQTAEGALNETQNILQRMRELSVQSANDTNVSADRTAIQDEVDQLVQEIDRIANTTEFNTKKLLNGDSGTKAIFQSNANVQVASADESTTAGTYAVAVITAATQGSVAVTGAFADGDLTQASGTASISVNGTAISFTFDNTSAATTATNFVNAVNAANIGVTATGDESNLALTTDSYGAAASVTITANAYTAEMNLTTDASTDRTDSGSDVVGTIGGVSAAGNGTTLVGAGAAAGLSVTLTNTAAAASGAKGDVSVVQNSLTAQIGANENQELTISISSMTASDLNVSSIDLTSQAGASSAITTINDAITSVSTERAKLGAVQNRLEHTIANLDTSAENLQASESRIRDVDMAKEMMEFTKNNILQQAAQSMLAQANQQPQGVLQLLRG